MAEGEKVKLIVSVPRELKERLDAVAKSEDRPLASVVRRMLGKAVAGVEDFRASQREPRVASGPHGPRGSLLTPVPVGGQDAAAGAGVEARREEAVAAPVTARVRPVDHVVIGGPNCTHPARYQLGKRCEAEGCGKVVR
jgi:predicted DNA-binding protein